MDETGDHRLSRMLLAALAAALVLRLLFAFLYWVDKPLTHDEREYLSLASSLAEGRGFTYDEPAPGEAHSERFGRAPLYPFFLSFIARATTPSTLVPAIKIVQAFLGTITVLLVALVANRASGHRAAAWGSWIGALYPPLAWMSSFVLSETLYSLVAFANVLLLCPILDGTRDILPQSQGRPGRRLIGAGVVGGLAALTRPAHLFFLALVGMWLLATRRYSWTVLFFLGALVTIGPWTMRNYMTYGRPVLIASEGGITFWTGNHPLSPGEGDMAANPAIKLDNLRLRAAYPDLSPEELEPIYYREAFGAIRANPAWWAKLEVRKLFYLWVPIGPSYMLHSRLYRMASWISYGALLPLGALGFLVLARHRTRPYTLWLLLLSAVLACLTFLPQERFRVPVIDPALIVGAAALLASRDDAQATASRAVAGGGSS